MADSRALKLPNTARPSPLLMTKLPQRANAKLFYVIKKNAFLAPEWEPVTTIDIDR